MKFIFYGLFSKPKSKTALYFNEEENLKQIFVKQK